MLQRVVVLLARHRRMSFISTDSIQTILALRPVIRFASSVATFHLSNVSQVYGQPSLLRTIGSRVSLSPSLTETIQYRSALPSPMLIGWNICSLRHFWRVIYCWQQQRGSLMINLLWDSACFMGFMSLPLNYAWVFPLRWSWMLNSRRLCGEPRFLVPNS